MWLLLLGMLAGAVAIAQPAAGDGVIEGRVVNAALSGTVVDEHGNPLMGTTVTLVPQEGAGPPIQQAVEDDGSFRIPTMPPGKYSVIAWEDLDVDRWRDPEYLKRFSGQATEVTVAARESRSVRLRAVGTGGR
jgi:hypothetical protein